MSIYLPRTIGTLAGWMMVAFVIGVAVHSTRVYPWLSVGQWTVIFIVLAVGFVFCAGHVSRDRRVRNDRREGEWIFVVMFAILLAFSLGVARCDLSSFPRLRFINGRGSLQAIVSTSPNMLERWRMLLTARIASALPRDEAALVTGILYGEKQLSKEQHDLFRSAGLLHIVAVSGSNVTIVVQVLALLVAHIGLRRRYNFVLTSIVLLLFCGFVGFSPSVTRAALMGWLVLVAREVGRISQPFRLLLVSAVILLIINPWQLVYDAGFALSFLAMWGLLSWTPLIESGLKWLPNWLETRTTLSMTLGATLMTVPYVAWSFGRLSLAGIFTNVFVLPLVSFIMMWGTITAAWGNGIGSLFINAPTLGLAKLIEGIAGLTRYTPWLEWSTKGMSSWSMIMIYVLFIYFWFVLSKKEEG